jgi:hypothetical protein
LTRITGLLLACCLAATVAPAVAYAADVRNVLAERDRTIAAGGRAVRVIVPQWQITTTIDVGRVAGDADSGGGGLLGAIVLSSLDDKRKVLTRTAYDRAEATIEPLRKALQGFDVDALALATTKAAVAKPAWFRPGSVELSKNKSPDALPTESAQLAEITYRYETSPDFTQIRVIAQIQLERPGAKAGAPVADAVYPQQVSSIVLLREPSFEPAENVAKWSDGDGRLARAALSSAFARLDQLIPFALDLSEADMKAFTAKGREKAFAAGYYGPLIERNADRPGETLLWKDGLVNVQQSAAEDVAGAR